MGNEEFYASIDIGTSKISMLVADIEEEKFHAVGYLRKDSKGVKDGKITNIESVSKIIAELIKEFDKDYKKGIKFVNVNISDLHLNTSNQNRQISFGGRSKVITKSDVIEAIQNSSAGAVASNKKKLKAVVNNFTVDDQVVDYPIGMKAEVLGVEVHMASVSNQSLNNIKKCLDECNIGTDHVILDSIASSTVCITQDDKDKGVCLLDIGAGVSNISVFSKGGVVFSHVFKIGGNSITENIAQVFNTSFTEAERLKLRYGSAILESTLADRLIEFEQLEVADACYLSLHELIFVLESSYKEICTLVKRTLKTQKLDRALKSGFVIMGGASKIPQCETLLLREFRVRTKVATINSDLVSGDEKVLNDMDYFSAFGLLTFNKSEFYLQEEERVQKGKWDRFKDLIDL
ncbi:cell division protein FtsA [Candidatus Thioglobus sp.]|uniref:cell division protein FtsA n=1 Tax=Candidatus Thioglobus sp. TaxID=2026721 RepID=UPI002612CB76|nr:cell division protein FtsA [Candidatus Thioglobus sp.]MDG2395224.1 cell division protein FtsA [Candidatus Thioglobus sp.]